MKLRLLGPLFALPLLFASPVLAQSGADAMGSSAIIGTVIDTATKQPLPGVVVTATSPAKPALRLTSVTGATGDYRVPLLPSGVYSLTFKKEAYKPSVLEGIQLNVRRILRVDTQLIASPLLLGETVEVIAKVNIDIGSTSQGRNVGRDILLLTSRCYYNPELTKPDFDSLVGAPEDGEDDTYDVPFNDSEHLERPISEPDSQLRIYYRRCREPEMSIPIPDGHRHSLYFASDHDRRQHPKDVAREAITDSYFKGHGVNPTVDTKEERFSAFSVNVNTASYELTRRRLERKLLPNEQKVRVEGFVNAFDYEYDSQDAPDEPFRVKVEGFPSPARKGYQVVHIGVKARKASQAPGAPSHLGFVLDVEDPKVARQEVAHDVNLQVEFDPEAVSRYRLMGYERRLLYEPRAPNDRVDADKVYEGHAVTALYEVKLRDPSRLTLGTLRIRYKAPEGGPPRLIEKALSSSLLRPAYDQATSPTRLSYVAAAFAEKLRGAYWVRPLTYDALVSLWEEIGTPLKSRPDVEELGALIRAAQKADERPDRFESFAPLRTMDSDRDPTLY